MDAHKNFAASTVAIAPSPATSGTTLSVAPGEGALFATPPFNLTVAPPGGAITAATAEIIRVTAKAGDDFTISRAQEGTTAKAIAVGWLVLDTMTVKTITDLAPIDSPAFTGIPTAPNPALGTTTNQIATMASVRIIGQETVYNLTDGATVTLDASLPVPGFVGFYLLTANGDRTISPPINAFRVGQRIVIAHLANGAARTLSLSTAANGFRFGSDIPALTTTASGKRDYIGAIFTGSADFRWDVVAYVKGF